MELVIFLAGIIVGITLAGSYFARQTYKSDEKHIETESLLKEHIKQLEEDKQATIDEFNDLKLEYELQRRTWGE